MARETPRIYCVPMVLERLPSVRLYFRFRGESFDPDAITQRLGISPTTHYRPGDPITKDGQGRRRGFGWMVKVNEVETLEIDAMLRELQERVDVPSSVVRKLCDDLQVEPVVICGVGQHADAITTPTLFFPVDFLHWLADMGASLEVDVIL